MRSKIILFIVLNPSLTESPFNFSRTDTSVLVIIHSDLSFLSSELLKLNIVLYRITQVDGIIKTNTEKVWYITVS